MAPSQETQDLLTQLTKTKTNRSVEKSNQASKALSPHWMKNRSTLWFAVLIFGPLFFLVAKFFPPSPISVGNTSLNPQSVLSAGTEEGCVATEVLAFNDDFEARQSSNWVDMDMSSSGFSYIEDPDNAENTVIEMLGSPKEEVGATSRPLPDGFSMRLRFLLESNVSLVLGLNGEIRNHWYQVILGPPGPNPPQLRRITPEENTSVRSMSDPSIGEWHFLEVSSFDNLESYFSFPANRCPKV